MIGRRRGEPSCPAAAQFLIGIQDPGGGLFIASLVEVDPVAGHARREGSRGLLGDGSAAGVHKRHRWVALRERWRPLLVLLRRLPARTVSLSRMPRSTILALGAMLDATSSSSATSLAISAEGRFNSGSPRRRRRHDARTRCTEVSAMARRPETSSSPIPRLAALAPGNAAARSKNSMVDEPMNSTPPGCTRSLANPRAGRRGGRDGGVGDLSGLWTRVRSCQPPGACPCRARPRRRSGRRRARRGASNGRGGQACRRV